MYHVLLQEVSILTCIHVYHAIEERVGIITDMTRSATSRDSI